MASECRTDGQERFVEKCLSKWIWMLCQPGVTMVLADDSEFADKAYFGM